MWTAQFRFQWLEKLRACVAVFLWLFRRKLRAPETGGGDDGAARRDYANSGQTLSEVPAVAGRPHHE